MSENPRRGRQTRNFTTNVPKTLDLKSSSEQIFFQKLSLGAPGLESLYYTFGPQISCIVLLFDKGKNTLKGLKFTYKR